MKKSFVIFSSVLIILLFSTISCFATEDITFPEIPTIEDAIDYEYVVVERLSDHTYWLSLFYSKDGELNSKHTYSDGDCNIKNNNSFRIYYDSYKLLDNTWSYISTRNINSGDTYEYSSDNIDAKKYIYSNVNIYNTDGSIFFQPPPATTLAAVLEEAQAVKNFQTMMSGIIPYLIALVVGLVAFWKAWQLLLIELRKA